MKVNNFLHLPPTDPAYRLQYLPRNLFSSAHTRVHGGLRDSIASIYSLNISESKNPSNTEAAAIDQAGRHVKMSTHQPSHSQVPAEPMNSPSQGDSIHIYGCKWAWCRSTFSDSAELTHHVIHEHARRAIPVRRRDIPLIRRAEDGTGESLRFSYILNGQSSTSATESSQKLVGDIRHGVAPSSLTGPFSSLPSPPASSRAKTSPLQNDQPLPRRATRSPGAPRERNDMEAPIPTTPTIQSWEQGEISRSFASLSSPAGSAASFSAPDIPNSPSFGSLVEQSAKRKLAFDAPENPATRKSRLYRHHPLSQSTSSNGSRVSVEQHLTQSLKSEDEDEEARGVINDDASSQQSSDHDDSMDVSPNAEDAVYQAQLPWGISQPQPAQNHESISNNSIQESQFEGANYDLLSQAPSQFQAAESFPYHYHGSKALTSSQMEPKSTAPLHLSPPAPLPSQKYATSTPQRQNWYQPPRLRRSISKKSDQAGADEDQTSPSQKSDQVPAHSQRSHSRNPSKSKKFRSGTLQITPATLSQDHMAEEPMSSAQDLVHNDALLQDIYGDILDNHDSQSHMDSSGSLDDEFSYPPLQTQAPYQSQQLSQF